MPDAILNGAAWDVHAHLVRPARVERVDEHLRPSELGTGVRVGARRGREWSVRSERMTGECEVGEAEAEEGGDRCDGWGWDVRFEGASGCL